MDGAEDDHATAVVAPDGEQLGRFAVHHDAAGLRTLITRLLAALFLRTWDALVDSTS